MATQAAGPQLSFRASAHEYVEKFNTSAVTAIGTSATDISPANNAVQSYGFLRRIKLRMRNSVVASSGGTLAADAPQNTLGTIQLTDPNLSTLSSLSTTTPLYLWTIPLELSESSGYGALPNFDAQSPYKLKVVTNTLANIYTTAPTTTNPSILLDYIIDCWTLPDAENKLSGYSQSQFPPGIGMLPGVEGVGCTVQHWTKSNPVITASSAVTASLIRKGNTYRQLVMAIRNSSAVRQATSNFPNPITFALDGAPLWNNVDPALIVERWMRRDVGQAGSTNVTSDTGVVPVPFADIDGINIAGVDGTLGSQGWLGNNQASRIEFSGTWGSNANVLDVLTNDVNAVSLAGSAYAFAYGQQLAAASLPSVRSGS